MTRTPVASSLFTSIGHDGDVLEVEFKNGKVYRVPNFTPEAHAEFLAAESLGAHFNKVIRANYWVQPLPDEKPTQETE